MKRYGAAVCTALLVVLAGGAAFAQTESSQSVAAVERCPATGCSGSNSEVAEGDVVAGTLRVRARSSRALGHDWVRLEARIDEDDWVCLRHWNTGANEVSEWYEWDTTAWPDPTSDCPSSPLHDTLTRNGAYDLRVVARDDLGETQPSSLFSLKIANPATTPAWADDPYAIGDDEGEPVVELRWEAVPEPDVVEYRYARTDPAGNRVEYAVSASRPGGQGCEQWGQDYVCWDDYFPDDGYEGSYTYTLYAMRSAPGATEPCELGSGSCVRSAASSDGSATLRAKVEPTPTPDPVDEDPGDDRSRRRDDRNGRNRDTTRPAPRPAASDDDWRDFYTGTYEEKLPYEDRPVLVAPPGSSGTLPSDDPTLPSIAGNGTLASDEFVADVTDRKRLWSSAAIGLLLLSLAAHAGRLLRDH